MLKLILFVLDMIINFVYKAVMSTVRYACCFAATLHVGVAISRYTSGTSEQNSDVGVVGAVLSSTVGGNGCRLEFIIKRQYIYGFPFFNSILSFATFWGKETSKATCVKATYEHTILRT